MKNKTRLLATIVVGTALLLEGHFLWAAEQEGDERPLESEESDSKGPKKNVMDGFLSFNGYYDTRDFANMTLVGLVNLPANFQYFTYTDYSNPLNPNDLQDLENFYSEQDIRWFLPKKLPLALTFQWVPQSGADNDLVRFGLLWRLSTTPILERFFKKIHMYYIIDFHGLQIDQMPGTGLEIEHHYSIDIFPEQLDNRLYIGGFADHDMNFGGGSDNNHIWITEHQLGVRLISWLYAVAEYRFTEPLSKQHGVGLGFEYRFVF